MRNMRRIYLDYAASTPVDPRLLRAMQPYFAKEFGNPGSLHSFGQAAMAAVDRSRETVARALGRSEGEGFREIIFTGSATEANNLALRGAVKLAMRVLRHAEPDEASLPPLHTEILRLRPQNDAVRARPRIIVSSIEHESVLETARDLERDGIEVVYLPVNTHGVVSLSALRSALSAETVLVSIMYGNNETGALQPIAKIAAIIREFREARVALYPTPYPLYPLLHTDAAQCFAYLPCLSDELGVDMMTLSAHKIGGPKGVGALFVRKHEIRSIKSETNPKLKYLKEGKFSDFGFRYSNLPVIAAAITGGGQEFGLRSATENVPSIVGFAKAVELAAKERAKNAKHVAGLKQLFLKEVKRIYPKAKVNGGKDVLPHILSLHLPGVAAADLLIALDRLGIAVASGSACNSRSSLPSHVLTAMGGERLAKESIRISFGRATTQAEIRAALLGFAQARKISSKP